MKTCEIDGCDAQAFTKLSHLNVGWRICQRHSQRRADLWLLLLKCELKTKRREFSILYWKMARFGKRRFSVPCGRCRIDLTNERAACPRRSSD